MHPTLVGIAGFREGGSLNGATYAAFDTPTAQQLFLDGQDAYNTFWITAKDGVSQEELTDAGQRGASRRLRGDHRVTTPPRSGPDRC